MIGILNIISEYWRWQYQKARYKNCYCRFDSNVLRSDKRCSDFKEEVAISNHGSHKLHL